MDEYKPITDGVLGYDFSIMDSLKNLDDLNKLPDFSDLIGETLPAEKHVENIEKYQAQSVELLKDIRENTATLHALVELINKSNENQDQIISVITNIFEIAKAKSKEEAEINFKKAMEIINASVNSAESIGKLAGWAIAIFNIVKNFL